VFATFNIPFKICGDILKSVRFFPPSFLIVFMWKLPTKTGNFLWRPDEKVS